MVSQRDRILNLAEHIKSSYNVDVVLFKNKARGNKGLFKTFANNKYRIDIAKNLNDTEAIRVLVHEFCHYIHYRYDKSLKSLDFIFSRYSELYEKELIDVTVQMVPKDFAKVLFDNKYSINAEIKDLSKKIKTIYPEFKLSEPLCILEKSLGYPAKYLLSYDRVKFLSRIYSIENIENELNNLTKEQILYLKLKSKQRALRRINSKISRLNSYYSSKTEIFARYCELYFMDYEKAYKFAPNVTSFFDMIIKDSKIPEFSELLRILKK